jgi:hypothetical protein
MTFTPARDAEPIAGYRLVEKLGVGGYGEVWKVTAPGGLAKAMKILFGDVDGSRAAQEARALARIKDIRHPFLLSLERIENIDGQLFIVMELAEGCLSDRFLECRTAGWQGIPRDELLAYLRDAAEALDYMSQTHGLQHLDIKPQNLLLVGKRIKVADFGLVKDLGGHGTTTPGGVTPMYAPPEAFDDRVSRYSDQYSLAVVYQEMLTGVRPFPGTTMMQLAAQHLNSPPLLTPLPAGDRAAIARALSKTPEQRFPSCLKMVEALAASGPSGREVQQGSGSAADIGPLSVAATPSCSVAPEGKTVRGLAGPVGRTDRLAEGQAAPTARTGRSGLRPTLFLGLGGLAAATLVRLKKRLCDKQGELAEAPIFRLLLVDSDREHLRQARQAGPRGALDAPETLLAPLHLPEYYRAESRKLLRWLDRRWFYGIPRSLQTEGVRPLGRLALVDNAADVLAGVRDSLAQITSAEAIARTVSATGAEVRDPQPRVFVIAAITGGTGGGMLVNMAYAVRQALAELDLSASGLCGMLLYATSPSRADREVARVNAYATLSELDHFSRPEAAYPGDPDYGLLPFGPGHPPFEECYLVHLGEALDGAAAQDATELLADYLFLDACPQGGALLDQLREQTHPAPGEQPRLRSIGLERLGAPGQRPLDLATRQLCLQLAESWLAGLGVEGLKDLEAEAKRQLAAHDLDEQLLARHMEQAVLAALGERPEAFIPGLLAEAAKAVGSHSRAQLLAHIDRQLALGDEPRAAGPPLPAAVHKSAEESGRRIGRALVDWLIGQVETPGRRFKAADHATTVLVRQLLALAEAVRDRLARVGDHRRRLRPQLLADRPRGTGGGRRWLPRALGGGSAHGEADIQAYCRLWLQEVSERGALALLGTVQGELGAFRDELPDYHRRLWQLTERFRTALESDPSLSTAAACPVQSGDAGEVPPGAEAGPWAELPPELVLRFDRSFQGQVVLQWGGMWAAFSQPPGAARPAADGRRPALEALAEDLPVAARAAIQAALNDLNVAQMFLQAHGGPQEVLRALLDHAEAARARLRLPRALEHLVVALPRGTAGDTLSDMIATALPGAPAAVVRTQDVFLFCYEAVGGSVSEVARALVGPAEVPPDVVRRVLTRRDVAWTVPDPV